MTVSTEFIMTVGIQSEFLKMCLYA